MRRIVRRVVIHHPAPRAGRSGGRGGGRALRGDRAAAPPRAARRRRPPRRGARSRPGASAAPARSADHPVVVMLHELAFPAMGTRVRLLASDPALLPAARAEVERLAARAHPLRPRERAVRAQRRPARASCRRRPTCAPRSAPRWPAPR